MRHPIPDVPRLAHLTTLALSALCIAASPAAARTSTAGAGKSIPAIKPPASAIASSVPGRVAVHLTNQQEQLINIRTVPVEQIPLMKTIRTVGRVVVDEARTATLNSRVMGWVEKLYVDTTGGIVAKGQPLLQIYSPALYSAQQDFLIVAHRRKTDGWDQSLFEAARQRLEFWGVSDAQIRHLEQTDRPSYTLTLTAPVGGTVLEKSVVDAQMVKPGMPLYRIADLSKVWVLAELFESDLPFVATGQDAVVAVPAYPGKELHGQVDFIYPFLQAKTRTDQARLVFTNPDGLLKPDMYVNVRLERNLGAPPSVPASAIFNTGNSQYVFVEEQPGLFAPVPVELGPQAGSRQVVLRGVKVGDRVVVDGNFMLDSESQLQASAGASSGGGTAGTSQMAPAPTPAGNAVAAARHPLPAAAADQAAALLHAYARMHDALSHDSFAASVPAVKAMRAAVASLAAPGLTPAASEALYIRKLDALDRTLSAAPPGDLTAARIQFGVISAALIDLLKTFPPPVTHPLTIMHCPMWTKSPADWLQTAAVTQNPFLGTKMPTCGSAVGTIGKAH